MNPRKQRAKKSKPVAAVVDLSSIDDTLDKSVPICLTPISDPLIRYLANQHTTQRFQPEPIDNNTCHEEQLLDVSDKIQEMQIKPKKIKPEDLKKNRSEAE